MILWINIWHGLGQQVAPLQPKFYPWYISTIHFWSTIHLQLQFTWTWSGLQITLFICQIDVVLFNHPKYFYVYTASDLFLTRQSNHWHVARDTFWNSNSLSEKKILKNVVLIFFIRCSIAFFLVEDKKTIGWSRIFIAGYGICTSVNASSAF